MPRDRVLPQFETLLIIVLLVLLLGSGAGYYVHNRYGRAGIGGVLGLVVVILVVIWLVSLGPPPTIPL